MSQVKRFGTKESPIIMKIGEVGYFNCTHWRPDPLYVRLQWENGRLSRLIALRYSGSPGQVEIFAQCPCCGEIINAVLNFF